MFFDCTQMNNSYRWDVTNWIKLTNSFSKELELLYVMYDVEKESEYVLRKDFE